jgi:hypothetical protein
MYQEYYFGCVGNQGSQELPNVCRTNPEEIVVQAVPRQKVGEER